MWNHLLILLNIRKPPFQEVLAHELTEAQANLQASKSQVEVARAHLALYTERVKRLKKEMEELVQPSKDSTF